MGRLFWVLVLPSFRPASRNPGFNLSLDSFRWKHSIPTFSENTSGPGSPMPLGDDEGEALRYSEKELRKPQKV
jgi:hypothetical protein